MTLVDISTPIRRGTIASRYLEAISCGGGGNDVSRLSMSSPPTVNTTILPDDVTRTNNNNSSQILEGAAGVDKMKNQAKALLNDSSCALTAPTAPLDGSASWTTAGTRTTSRSDRTPARRLSGASGRNGSFRSRNNNSHSSSSNNRSGGANASASTSATVHTIATPKVKLGIEDDCSSIENDESSSSSTPHRRKPAHLSINNDNRDDTALGNSTISLDCAMSNSYFISKYGAPSQSQQRGRRSVGVNDSSWIGNRSNRGNRGVFPKTSPSSIKTQQTRWNNFRQQQQRQQLKEPYPIRPTGHLNGEPPKYSPKSDNNYDAKTEVLHNLSSKNRQNWGNNNHNDNKYNNNDESSALSEAGAATEIMTNRTVDILKSRPSPSPQLRGPPTVRRRVWPPAKNGPPAQKSLLDDNNSFESSTFRQRIVDPHGISLFDGLGSDSMSAATSSKSSLSRLSNHMRTIGSSLGLSKSQDTTSSSLNTLDTSANNSLRVEIGSNTHNFDGTKFEAAAAAFGGSQMHGNETKETDGPDIPSSGSENKEESTPKRDGMRVAAMFGGRNVSSQKNSSRSHPTARRLSQNRTPEPKSFQPRTTPEPPSLQKSQPSDEPKIMPQHEETSRATPHAPIQKNASVAAATSSSEESKNSKQSQRYEESSTTDDDTLYVTRRNDRGDGKTHNYVVCNHRRQSNMDEVFHRRTTSDASNGFTPISLAEKERLGDISRGGKSPIQPLFSLDRVEFSFDSQTQSPSRRVRSKSLSRMIERKKELQLLEQEQRRPVRSKSLSAAESRRRQLDRDMEEPDPIFCPESMSPPPDEPMSLSFPSTTEDDQSLGGVNRSSLSMSLSVPSGDVQSMKAVFSPVSRGSTPQNRANRSTDGEASTSHYTDVESELVQIMDSSNERQKARSSKPPENAVSASEILEDLYQRRAERQSTAPKQPSSQSYRLSMVAASGSPGHYLGRNEEHRAVSVNDKRQVTNDQRDEIKSHNNNNNNNNNNRIMKQTNGFAMTNEAEAADQANENCEDSARSVKEKIQAFSSRQPDQWNTNYSRAQPLSNSTGRGSKPYDEGEESQKNRISVLAAHLDRISGQEEKKDDDKSIDMSTIATRSLHENNDDFDDDDDRSVRSLREKFEREFSAVVENITAVRNEHGDNDDDDRSVKSLRDMFEKKSHKHEERHAHDSGYDGDEGSVKSLRKSFEPPPMKPANYQVSRLRDRFEGNKGEAGPARKNVGNSRRVISEFSPRYIGEVTYPFDGHHQEPVPQHAHNLDNRASERSMEASRVSHPGVFGNELLTKRAYPDPAPSSALSRSEQQESPAVAESRDKLINSHAEVISQLQTVLQERRPAEIDNVASNRHASLLEKSGTSITKSDNGNSRSATGALISTQQTRYSNATSSGASLESRYGRQVSTGPAHRWRVTSSSVNAPRNVPEYAVSNKSKQVGSLAYSISPFQDSGKLGGSGDAPGVATQAGVCYRTSPGRALDSTFATKISMGATHGDIPAPSPYPQGKIPELAATHESKHSASVGPVVSPFLSMRDRLKVFSKSMNGRGFLEEGKNVKSSFKRHSAKRHPLASQEKLGGKIDDADAEIGRTGSYDLSSVVSDGSTDDPGYKHSLDEIQKNLVSVLEEIQKRDTRENGETKPLQTQRPVGGFFGRTNQEIRENQRKTEVNEKVITAPLPASHIGPSSKQDDLNQKVSMTSSPSNRVVLSSKEDDFQVPTDESRSKDHREGGEGVDYGQTEKKTTIFRMEGDAEDGIYVIKQKSTEQNPFDTPGRGSAVRGTSSNLKTKSTESDFSDGVTLDVSVAEVSQLSNPSAIRSKESKEAKDNERGSTHSSSTLEPMAKTSEASSSQLSEAAAPLMGGDMRLNLMSDEMSDAKQHSIAESDEHWGASRGQDRKIHVQAQQPSSDAEQQPKDHVEEQSGVEWDIQQVQSSFPFKSSHSENLFDIDPNAESDTFPVSDWASFDQDDSSWMNGLQGESTIDNGFLTAPLPTSSSRGAASKNQESQHGRPSTPAFGQPFPESQPSSKSHPIPNRNFPRANRGSSFPPVDKWGNDVPVADGRMHVLKTSYPARQQNMSPKLNTHQSTVRAGASSHIGPNASELNGQRVSDRTHHAIFPTTTPKVLTGRVTPSTEKSPTAAPVKTPPFQFDEDYETIMESRHKMLVSRQRAHVQKRFAREGTKHVDIHTPEKAPPSPYTRSPPVGSIPGQSSTRTYSLPSHSRKLQSDQTSSKNSGGFFGRTYPVRSPAPNEQHATSVPLESASATNEPKQEPVFDLSASYSRYQAARKNTPSATISSARSPNRQLPQHHETSNSFSYLDAQPEQWNSTSKPPSSSFYSRMATRLGFASSGGSKQEALITRLRSVQASRMRRSKRREAAATAPPATAIQTSYGQNHYPVQSHRQRSSHMVSTAGMQQSEDVSEDIASMLEVD